MMPDLPNVGLERDIEQFMEFFENPAFRPDGLKLYPTLVIRGTGRCNLQLKGGGRTGLQDLMFLNSILLWSSGVQVGVIYS